MNWNARLGLNIRLWRQTRGWSQQTLAGEAELSLRFLAGIERGEENPSLETLLAISRALEIDPSALFATTETATPEQ
ncbi:MAG: XRE family transcriptional regulator [Alphaproteobacteria bacterium]|nr:MAG: XRE family transcriptional regulator [Alphaproteobacteria bacterium]